MANVAKDFAQLISQSKSNKTGPYDTQATVKRVEGNTVWVSIPGGVDETPIDKTVNCTAGDKVQVRVSGGRAWITGNASAPPTDDKTANEAKTKAVVAEATAIDAKETADAVEGIAVNASATAVTAKAIAEGVNEHFWHDNTGAHVTEVTQEEWNEPTDPNYHSGGNTLITTQGMAIRNGLVNLAEFGASGATIGVSGSQIAHLGYGPGTDSGGGTSDAPYYTLGTRKTGNLYDENEGYYFGDVCIYNDAEYFCIDSTSGPWDATKWILAIGNYSTALGYNVVSAGCDSVAEGVSSISTGRSSHAEGGSVATGDYSHAEGRSRAFGDYSHAEGNLCRATGDNSSASGESTEAKGDNQTVIGRYNYIAPGDENKYAFIIGNGTYSPWAPSNALTVAWNGDVKSSGDIEDGSGNVLSDKADTTAIPTKTSDLNNDSGFVSGTGFFQIVQLAVTTSSSISAHGSYANATYTVPAGDRPSGMTLAGIVGWGASNYRLSPSTAFVNGTHSISVTLANTSASSVSSGATVNFRLLYIKATSA